MLTVNRLASTACRATRTAVPLSRSNATCAYATAAASPDWLQRDKLKQKLDAILKEHNTRQQRLDYAEKILPYYALFPNEPDPTKPSKAAIEAAVQSSFTVPQGGAVPIPKWREAVAKEEKEWAEKEELERQSKREKEHKAHH